MSGCVRRLNGVLQWMNTPVQLCGSRSEDTRARPRPVLSRDADAGFTRNLRSSLSLRLVRVDREGPRFTGNRAQDRKLGPALLRAAQEAVLLGSRRTDAQNQFRAYVLQVGTGGRPGLATSGFT